MQAEKKKYQAEAAERARRKAEQAKQALEAFQRMNNVPADPNAQVNSLPRTVSRSSSGVSLCAFICPTEAHSLRPGALTHTCMSH